MGDTGKHAKVLLVVLLFAGGCKGRHLIGDTSIDPLVDDVAVEDMMEDGEEEPCVASGPEVLATEVRVTDREERVGCPALAWSGSEILLTWVYMDLSWTPNNSLVMLTRLDPDGAVIEELEVAEGIWLEYPDIWWTGSEIAVAWSAFGDDRIMLANLDPEGTVRGTTPIIPAGPRWGMAWTGSEFGVLREVRDGPSEEIDLYFQTLDASGTPISSDLPVAYPDVEHEGSPSLAWTGNGFSLAWEGMSEGYSNVYFARIDRDGEFLVDPALITDIGAYYVPNVSGDDESSGLAMWRWGMNREVFLYVLDSSGEEAGPPSRVTDPLWSSVSPVVEWTGSLFGVAWLTGRWHRMSPGFALFDERGSMIGEPLIVSNERKAVQYYSDHPPNIDLLWTGSEFVLVWDDWRDAPDPDDCPNDEGQWGNCYSELYLARLGVCGIVQPRCQADRDCDDGVPCTRDVCNTSTGECTSTPASGPGLDMVDVAVTDHEWFAGGAGIVAHGDTLGIAWVDGRDSGCRDPFCETSDYFQLYSVDGSPRGTELGLTEAGSPYHAGQMVWTGSAYGVGGLKDDPDSARSVWLSVVSGDGTEMGTPTEVAPSELDAMSPEVAWSGSEFALFWGEYSWGFAPLSVRLARFAPDGAHIGTTIIDTDYDITPHFLDLEWTGSEYVAAYYRSSDYIVARVSPEGVPVDEILGDATTLRARLELAWTGSELRLFASLHDETCGLGNCLDILMYPVDLAAGDVLEPVLASHGEGDFIVADSLWTGSEIVLSWYDDTGWGYPGYITWLAPDGTRVHEDLKLNAPVDIAWTGSEVALAWDDWKDGVWNVYMNRIGWCE